MHAEARYNGFSVFGLGTKAIVDLVRGSAGLPDEPWDMRRPMKPHRPKHKLFGQKPKRIPFSDFIEIAVGSYGWQINDGSCDILDLGNGLRQAAVDRELTLYGRSGCVHMPRAYWDNYPLQPIPVEHLCSHWIDIASALHDENFETKKIFAIGSTDHGAIGYVDLWINRKEGLRWLKRQGREWRGRTDARQGGPESMRQTIWQHLDSARPPSLEDFPKPPALEDFADASALEGLPEPAALEDLAEPIALEDLAERKALEDLANPRPFGTIER